MHEKAIEAIVKELTTVANDLQYLTPPEKRGKCIIAVGEPTTAFAMGGVGQTVYYKVISTLLHEKHGWSARYSERHLEDKLMGMLRVAVETCSTAHLQSQFAELVREYEGLAEEWLVYVPLAGIRMGIGELNLGNVTIVNVVKEVEAELYERCRSITMSNQVMSLEARRQYAEQGEQQIKNIAGRPCATMTICGDRRRAEEIAIGEARHAISLMRFALIMTVSRRDRIVVGLQGEVPDDGRHTLTVKTDNTGSGFVESLVYHTFTITEATVEKMREVGVFELSAMLTAKQRTDFEEVILRAVHWLASAQAQFENENALLNLVTCLETFLKPDKADPITATIAEGVAILTADTVEERKKRKSRVKEFYGMRSRLTHEGDGAISGADLGELTAIARDLTVNMINRRHEFKTQQDLRNWLDDKRLGG